MLDPYTSDVLFHFVGHATPTDDDKNWSILEAVLRDRCISHAPHAPGPGKISYTFNEQGSLLDETLFVPSVTCFADIPKSGLGIHVSKYGRFGLGFRRSLLVEHGARPVMYFPIRPGDSQLTGIVGGYLLKDIESVYRGLKRHFYERISAADRQQMVRHMCTIPEGEPEVLRATDAIFAKDFLAFVKPFNPNLADGDADNYYMEREWRKYGNFTFRFEDVDIVCAPGDRWQQLIEVFPELKGKKLLET